MSHHTARPLLNPANMPSARFFGGIGIEAGMRVLDVGCANGDLSRFVARLAGSGGEVVAIDRSDKALTSARDTDVEPLAAPIRYHQVDLADELPKLGRFDAIVGRRVLMYLPGAVRSLEKLAALMKPGAVLAFQEHARTSFPVGLNDLAVHARLYDWMWSTVEAEGGDVRLAFRLAGLMQALGLSIEEARSEAILLQAGAPSFLPTLARIMLPRMIEHGVVNAEEVAIESLVDRLEEEHRSAGGAIAWDLAFLVSARS